MNNRKLYLLLFLSAIILSSCFSVAHETVSNQPKMAIKEAMDVIKESIKDTIQNPYFVEQKAVSDVVLSKDGFTLIHPDGPKKHYSYNDIINPVVVHEAIHNLYFIKFNNQSEADAVLFNHKKSATMFADALYFLKHYNDPDVKQERAQEQSDCLRQVRNTSVDLILSGATADDLSLPCSGVPQDQIEATLNDILVEWKSKGLRVLLQSSSPFQLNDLVVKMEKGILKLDLKAKQLKDLADEDARQVKAPGAEASVKQAPGALTVSHLLDQRKTILMVILGSVKQAAGQRASGS